MRPSFFHHLHPLTIPAAQARWRYTLGAGGLAVFLMLVAIATGALLMFFYIPTPGAAAESIQTITFLVPYGGLIRNLHYWSAQALVIFTGVHLLRVVLTGAYAPPRQVNYLLGLILLVLVLLLDFSGYVLRWDEGVRWALVAGTNLVKTVPLAGDGLYALVVGGSQPGAGDSDPVLRLASVRVDPAAHRGRGLAPFQGPSRWRTGCAASRIPRNGGPHLPSRIGAAGGPAAVAASLVLLALAVFFPAPLAAPITEKSAGAAGVHAPWFFLWVQQLLRWGDPFLMGVLLPLLIVAGLALIPYVMPAPPPAQLGHWFPQGSRLAQVVIAGMIVVLVGLTVLGYLN